MGESQNEALALFNEMKNSIKKSGGSFCQYRACNLSVDTIYDLENIQNGVVFARSPLYMNDPFDSMIGFSSEKLYKDFCNMIVTNIHDEMTKVFMRILLQEKALGKVAELISIIKEFQAFLRAQKRKMNSSEPNISAFAIRQRNVLFKKMSPALKRKIGNIQVFAALAFFTADIDLSRITEQQLLQMVQIDGALFALLNKFDEVKETIYFPKFKEFLSQITISCFSASGWDNQLMWSHYANSYSGICVEYDFSTVDGNTGFVFPVKYSSERPTITLSDFGFSVSGSGELEWNTDKSDFKVIFSYLLTKNKCWEYEKEWRIINIGEKNTPIFIDLPNIKSITLGLNMNIVCKHLLIDICHSKRIPCYQLVLDSERFALTREPIDMNHNGFNINEEMSYIHHISDHIIAISGKLKGIDGEEIFDKEAQCFKSSQFFNLMLQLNDVLFHVYCLKKSINNLFICAAGEISDETIVDLRDNIKIIDELSEELNIHPLEVIEAIRRLKIVGIISPDIHKRALATLNTNNALQEKIAAIEWDSRIRPKEECSSSNPIGTP